jgi:hypothetical protein
MNEKLDQILAEMKVGFKEVNHKLNSIQEQVVRNSEAITEILDGQQRQDRILEMLSVRSIEQEADIKDFKRMR